ncbi:LPO_1073/Vpar_1526 family protein [Polaromonas sp.]|uniref:LPO_1073/Vpar_1526 family protein n=1 Tax=Polaromonas sp. TaxID=1869339 RepID=UPI002730B0E4|nr:LPO_1073/Vpar_1526 family protein [Polaromonas sp.]MDP2449362.1 hypothetical protein [Polaromonas sp.]
MFWKKQTQSQEGTGTAVQATGNVIITVNNQGLTVGDVKEIALDVMRANLLDFKGRAQETALERGAEITDKFLAKLAEDNPEGLQQAETPDFQDALFTIQKEYAKAGDADLGDLLVDLLVDRTKQEERNIMQIVLNESLHTAPKLTDGQIAALSAIFLCRYVQNNGLGSIAALGEFLEKHIGATIGKISYSDSTFNHLEFAGCGTVSAFGGHSLEGIWTQIYPGLFKSGFEEAKTEGLQLSAEVMRRLILPCLNDATKLQVAALNMTVLEEKLVANGVGVEDAQTLKNLLTEGTYGEPEIRTRVLAVAPFLTEFLDRWKATSISKFSLTSVGMAIGHANIKRITGEFSSLKIWIN